MDSHECLFNIQPDFNMEFSNHESHHSQENVSQSGKQRGEEYFQHQTRHNLEEIPSINEDLLANHKFDE